MATIPRHMRRLGGFDQPAVVDAGLRPLMRVTMAALTPPVLERLHAVLAPEAYAVAHDAVAGPPPLRDEVVAPAEVRRRIGQPRSSRNPGMTRQRGGSRRSPVKLRATSRRAARPPR